MKQYLQDSIVLQRCRKHPLLTKSRPNFYLDQITIFGRQCVPVNRKPKQYKLGSTLYATMPQSQHIIFNVFMYIFAMCKIRKVTDLHPCKRDLKNRNKM